MWYLINQSGERTEHTAPDERTAYKICKQSEKYTDYIYVDEADYYGDYYED